MSINKTLNKIVLALYYITTIFFALFMAYGMTKQSIDLGFMFFGFVVVYDILAILSLLWFFNLYKTERASIDNDDSQYATIIFVRSVIMIAIISVFCVVTALVG